MSSTYVLVEGVNIYANVLDTNQISVIRGSSFLLKDAITTVETELQGHLEPLSVGASSGLFRLLPDCKINDVLERIHAILTCQDKDTPFFTQSFIVEHCKATNLPEAKEKLLGQLRLRQLLSATLVSDNPVPAQSPGPSQWHGVRPLQERADTVTYSPPGQPKTTHKISRSEKLRWQYGRNREREINQGYHLEEVERVCGESPGSTCSIDNPEGYQELRAKLAEWGYCRELGHIADSRRLEEEQDDLPHPRYPKLDGKIAVFYADGNSFTKIQRDYINYASDKDQAQQEFDRDIRGKRSQLLADLLGEMLKDDGRLPHMKTRSLHNVKEGEESKWIKALRFETLLWGGDELMFVLPAWAGFEFARLFFERTADWKIGTTPFTHSAGLVFCSAKTPIRIARELASMIADDIKERTERNGGKRNAWDYMVLESIDYPTHRDYQRFLEERYGVQNKTNRPICIPGTNNVWTTRRNDMKNMLTGILPVRQLYRLGQAITRETPDKLFHADAQKAPPEWWNIKEPATLLEQLEQRMLQVCDKRSDLVKRCNNFANLFGIDVCNDRQRAWLWLHLLELREYIAPRETQGGGNA